MPAPGYLRMTMNVRTVYLGLGTNLSDRHAWWIKDWRRWKRPWWHGSPSSLVHVVTLRNGGLGDGGGQPAFLNMVVGVDTDMPLDELFHVLLDIERAHGRVRDASSEGYLNRTLDMDILCTSKGESWSTDDLAVPHPRMASRRFVLQPLADLAPDLEVGGQTVRMALDACPAVPKVVPVATPS